MKFGLTLFVVIFSLQTRADLSARDVMAKNEEARRIGTITSSAKLITGGGGKSERTKDFNWWRKLAPDKVHFKTLTRFNAPSEIRNEAILFLEGEGDQTEVLIYLPSYKKIRRVESNQQSGSFMGSEFSYADIAAPHLEDYKYSMEKKEKCPGESLDCYVVRFEPANDAISDRTGMSYGVTWVRSDNFMGVKTDFYDPDSKLWKVLEASEIKEVDKANHKWLSHRLKMENKKTGRFTVFTFSDVVVNQAISDSIFTQNNMSKEK